MPGDLLGDGEDPAEVGAAVGAVLYSRARTTLKTINPKPDVTVQTLKEDAQWAKTRKS